MTMFEVKIIIGEQTSPTTIKPVSVASYRFTASSSTAAMNVAIEWAIPVVSEIKQQKKIFCSMCLSPVNNLPEILFRQKWSADLRFFEWSINSKDSFDVAVKTFMGQKNQTESETKHVQHARMESC